MDWLNKVFLNFYKDIIYISANPYISNVKYRGFHGSKHFYRVEPVWDYGWDSNIGTVHPKTVVWSTIRLVKKYPYYRFIIHFAQPHAPYIGYKGLILKEYIRKRIGNVTYKEQYIHKMIDYVWKGEIYVYDVIEAYLENLSIVIEYVYKLVEHLDGKVVLTADHGEAFGEKGVFFHPCGVYIKELVLVPWIVIKKRTSEYEKRKELYFRIKSLRDRLRSKTS